MAHLDYAREPVLYQSHEVWGTFRATAGLLPVAILYGNPKSAVPGRSLVRDCRQARCPHP